MGSNECSLSLGVLPAETEAEIAEQQAAGHLTWERPGEVETVSDPRTEYDAWHRRAFPFRSGGSTHLSCAHDNRHELHQHGGLADHWFLDDKDILCRPVFVAPFMKASRIEKRKSSTTSLPSGPSVVRLTSVVIKSLQNVWSLKSFENYNIIFFSKNAFRLNVFVASNDLHTPHVHLSRQCCLPPSQSQ